MTKLPNTRNRTRAPKSESHRAKRPAASTAGRGKSAHQTNTPVRAGTKQAKLIDMPKRPDGASIAQMGARTGWQPHSVRAGLTGLRKRGVAITRKTNDAGTTVYRIVPQRKRSSS